MTATTFDGPVDPDLACLLVQSPEELQRMLESLPEGGDTGILGTLESLTMTVMSSIE